MTLPLLIAVAAAYLGASLLYLRLFLAGGEAGEAAARRTLAAGFLLHTASFVLLHVWAVREGIAVQESVSFMAYAIVGLWLVFQHRWRAKVLGAVLAPLAFLLVFYATLPLGPGASDTGLRSFWSHFHILLSIGGFAFLAVAFAAGLTYLLQDRKLKGRKTESIEQVVFRLPSLEVLDRMNSFCLLYGFPILTLGMIMGGLWEWALGSGWGWDLKIQLSIATWVFYLIVLLARLVGHQRGRRVALLSVVGFVMLASSYIGGRALG
ncbi:MAG: cytochrome c biogenesis protein CcsA [Deltaproteobacteria bacterium]|nr:cytochrome c biogenesis protein CcsA [Deltaproteobacteria bacterium]